MSCSNPGMRSTLGSTAISSAASSAWSDAGDAEGVAGLQIDRPEPVQPALGAAHAVVPPQALVPAHRDGLRERLPPEMGHRVEGEALRLEAVRPLVVHAHPHEREQLGVGDAHRDLELAAPVDDAAGERALEGDGA